MKCIHKSRHEFMGWPNINHFMFQATINVNLVSFVTSRVSKSRVSAHGFTFINQHSFNFSNAESFT